MKEAEIFSDALEHEPAKRAEFLQNACQGDEQLLAKVEALLRAHDDEGGFLDEPPSEIGVTVRMTAEERQSAQSRSRSVREHEPPSMIVEREGGKVMYFGEYVLMGEIARGAMGVVYRAEQSTLKRPVAIKMIRSTLLANDGDVARFKSEAEAAASLDHPNIVPIYEVGEFEGQHYFTMKLVEGGTLRDRMDQFRRDPRLAAEFMSKVASAVHAAHQRGILHRDIKPGNILIDHENKPHVTDFGLAKDMDSASGLTLSGQIVGTPSYMAPEQAEASANLTTAADVYGLGAVFYEMLTGEPPFKGETTLETLRLVTESEAAHPSSINARVNRDLATIALKCLSKDPAKRYASAQGLVNDLERWLRGEPIHARPVSTLEKVFKWMKRRPAPAAAVALGALFLLTLGIGGPIVAFQQTKLREDAELARSAESDARAAEQNARLRAEDATRVANDLAEANRRNLYAAEMVVATHAIQGSSGIKTVRDTVNRWVPKEGEADLRGWEWYFLASESKERAATIFRHRSNIMACDWTPDGKAIVSVDSDGQAVLWNASTGAKIRQFQARLGTIGAALICVRISPDGRRVAAAQLKVKDPEVRIWNVLDGKLVHTITGTGGPIRSIDWSPNGYLLAVAKGDTGVSIWDSRAESQEIVYSGNAVSVCWGPSGKRLAIAEHHEPPRIFNLETGETLSMERNRGAQHCLSIDWSDDGRWLAGGDLTGTVEVWNADTGRPRDEYLRIDQSIRSLQWSGDSRILAMGDPSGRVHLWEPDAKTGVHVLRGHSRIVNDVNWSPDSTKIASASSDDTVRVWNWDRELSGKRWRAGQNSSPAWSSDGTRLAFINDRQGIEILDGSDQFRTIKIEGRNPKHVDWNPDGTALSVAFWNGGAAVVDPASGHIRFSLATGKVDQTEWSPDGRYIALASPEGLTLCSGVDGTESAFFEKSMPGVQGVAWRPDSKAIAWISSWMFGVADVTTDGALINTDRIRDVGTTGARAVSWSPDGKILAVGMDDMPVGLRNPDSLDTERVLSGHSGQVTSLDWGPGGRRIASGSEDGNLRMWDVESGRLVFTMKGQGPVNDFEWSPEGSRIAVSYFHSGGTVATVQVFDAIEGMADHPREDYLMALINREAKIEDASWLDAVPDLKTSEAAWVIFRHLLEAGQRRPEFKGSASARFAMGLAKSQPSLFEEVRREHPESRLLDLALARDLTWRMKWEEAAVVYFQALGDGLAHSEPYFEAATLSVMTGDRESYERYLEETRVRYEQSPQDSETSLNYAHTLALVPMDSAPDTDLAAALDSTLIAAKQPWSHYARAMLALRSGDQEKADRVLNRMKHKRYSHHVHVSLALLAHSKGELESAVEHLAEADHAMKRLRLESSGHVAGWPGAVTDWLYFNVLRREAARLIEERTDFESHLFPQRKLEPFFRFYGTDNWSGYGLYLRTALKSGADFKELAPELAGTMSQSEVESILNHWLGEESAEHEAKKAIDGLFEWRGYRYRKMGLIEEAAAAFRHVQSPSQGARDTLILLQDWSAAADEAEALILAQPERSDPSWNRAAGLIFLSSDADRYHNFTIRLLEQFDQPTEFKVARDVLKLATLTPRATEYDLGEFKQIVEANVEGGDGSNFRIRNGLSALAALAIREERYEDGIRLLDTVSENLEGSRAMLGVRRSLKAIAFARLEQPEQAREILDSANEIVDSFYRSLERGELPSYWHDMLLADIFRREAEGILSEMEKD